MEQDWYTADKVEKLVSTFINKGKIDLVSKVFIKFSYINEEVDKKFRTLVPIFYEERVGKMKEEFRKELYAKYIQEYERLVPINT